MKLRVLRWWLCSLLFVYSGARAADAGSFVAAEAAVDAERFPDAIALYDQIHAEHLDWVWPRKQRHLDAYARFRAGRLAEAEARWGALLCETQSDPLTFRIAYNLALVQQRQQQAERAYWTLRLVPGDLVATQSKPVQLAFYQLAEAIAADREEYAAAAEILVRVLPLYPNGEDRRAAIARFTELVTKVTELSEWKHLLTITTNPALLKILDAHRPPRQSATRGTRAQSVASADGIAGLTVHPIRGSAETAVGEDKSEIRLQLVGQYQGAPGRILLCGGVPVPVDDKGRFTLHLAVGKGGGAHTILLALGGGRRPEQQQEDFFQADWTQFKPPKLPEALADYEPDAPKRVSKKHSGDWELVAGLDLVASTATQTGVGETKQKWLSANARADWAIFAPLFFEARADVDLFAWSGDASGASFRTAVVALDSGYRLALADDWALSPALGVRVLTSSASTALLGPEYLVSPEFGARLDWRLDADNRLSAALQLAPVFSKDAGTGSSKWYWGFGVEYGRGAWGAEVRTDNYVVGLAQGEFSLHRWSLGGRYRF